MKYYQAKCPDCGQTIHVHRSGKQLFLKNVCDCLRFYEAIAPLKLSSVKSMFNRQFRVEFNRDRTATVVLR